MDHDQYAQYLPLTGAESVMGKTPERPRRSPAYRVKYFLTKTPMGAGITVWLVLIGLVFAAAPFAWFVSRVVGPVFVWWFKLWGFK